MRPLSRSAAYLLLLPALLPGQGTAASREAEALEARLMADVSWLCDPARRGRGDLEAREEVAAWLSGRFRKAELEPLFDGRCRRHFRVPGGIEGINVGAFLPGPGWPAKRDHMVISAHYDHLGMADGRPFPGAADNAAGVAVLLEVARRLSLGGAPLRHSVVFLAFDQEEKGMIGSRIYARRPALPLEAMQLFMTVDILGRRLFELPGEYLVLLGFEHAPGLLGLLEEVEPGTPLRLLHVGADVIGDRSDYVPFRNREVPFLFFTSGEYRDYHRHTDLPGRLEPELLAHQARYIAEACAHLAGAPGLPGFTRGATVHGEELATLRRVLELMRLSADEELRDRLALMTRELEDLQKAQAPPRVRLRSLARHVMLELRGRMGRKR